MRRWLVEGGNGMSKRTSLRMARTPRSTGKSGPGEFLIGGKEFFGHPVRKPDGEGDFAISIYPRENARKRPRTACGRRKERLGTDESRALCCSAAQGPA